VRVRHWKPRPPHGRANLVLSSLNLFLLNYYEDYLTDLKVTREDQGNQEAFYWDAKQAVFGVKGKDKNSDDVIASISREDVITFVADETGGGATYARIVVQTYEPDGGTLGSHPPADTYLWLYDALGNLKASNDDGDPNVIGSTQSGSSLIDYKEGLAPGTYYIKVTNGLALSAPNSLGQYAVRVFALTSTQGIPGYPEPDNIILENDPYEPDDTLGAAPPLSEDPKAVIKPNDTAGAMRVLNPAIDVDWIMVDLPVVINPQ
jgi:hypothetical protein